MTQEEEFKAKLSFVTVKDDNKTMLLNGDLDYPVKLPSNIIISKKNATDKKRIVETRILGGCDKFHIDYVSEENLKNSTKEVVDSLYERVRVTKNYVVPPSSPEIAEKYRNDYFEYLVDCDKRTVKGEDSLLRQINYTTLSGYTPHP